jgi:flavorubredoxin
VGTEIYNKDNHVCVCFSDLVEGEGIQSNQFLLLDDDHAALIDPGGNLTYSRLYIHAGRYTTIKKLDYVIASHQDPDIVASVSKWLLGTSCKVVISKIWERFLPHFCSPGSYTEDRLIVIPDEGMDIQLGKFSLKAIPAHFLHSVGNFHFYDPVAKILFSGDVGASISDDDASSPVTDFDEHIPHMLGFHQRYMVSNAACRYWVNMVRNLELEWIIPQHGAPYKGKKVIDQFLSWMENLECGIDLFTQKNYEIPSDN